MSNIIIESLDGARRLAHRFEAVLTIEDFRQLGGVRLENTEGASRRQLILRFDDISEAVPNRRLATVFDIEEAIAFARAAQDKPLLIHCNAGISRSSAMALAVLADRRGPGAEASALRELIARRPGSIPNIHVVALADTFLDRRGALIAALVEWSEGQDWRYPEAWATRVDRQPTPLPASVMATNELGKLTARVDKIIPANAEMLFDFVINPLNDRQWIDAISDVRQLGDGPVQIGARFEQSAVGPIGKAEVVWEVTELEPPCRFVCRSVSGAYRFTGGYELTPLGSRTRIAKFASFGRTGMLMAVPQSLGQALMRRQFERWLATLAQIASRW